MVLYSSVVLAHGSDYRDGESSMYDFNCLQENFFWAFVQQGWSQTGKPKVPAVLVMALAGESMQNRNTQ
jgi:acid phosphatase class B